MTKKEMGMYQNWLRATMTTLDDAYERPSIYKQRAYEWCLEQARELGGYDIRIPSRNTFGFTLAYLFTVNGKRWMRYETKDNTYVFEIDETNLAEELKGFDR